MPKESALWVSGSDVIPMFPTFVWRLQLEAQLRRGIDAKMLTQAETFTPPREDAQ